MTRYRHISVAIPVLAEFENLPHIFKSLKSQTFSDFDVFVCVNNPDGWSYNGNESERAMYLDNQESLKWLRRQNEQMINLHVFDYSSQSKGWKGKRYGVGWARKVLMDAIMSEHGNDDLVVSLDADTDFSDRYFEVVLDVMNNNPYGSCLSVPYYHPLSGNEGSDRAMLRYEIYMRHYLVNMLNIAMRLKKECVDFPYAFTALGSAMVFPLWAYRRVGGITPLQGGEDFYLMQKFAKTGKVLLSCNEVVRPQGRPSSRVPFGTGPAIAKGVDSMEDSYPFYPHEAFDAVAETYSIFPSLYETDLETPMTSFLCKQLGTNDIWLPLRRNFRSRELFVHACYERVDGLRILQFLKFFRNEMIHEHLPVRSSEEELKFFCSNHGISLPDNFSFGSSPIDDISSLRQNFFALELSFRNFL